MGGSQTSNDIRAHRVTREDCPFGTAVVEDGRQVFHVSVESVRPRQSRAGAAATQIRHHEGDLTIRQMAGHGRQQAVRPCDAMNTQHY